MSGKRRKVTGDPKSFRGEFSFVNKDASNIDSKDHNAAVSWHVMNRYERWKRQEEAKKLRASANLPKSPFPPSSAAPSVSGPSGSVPDAENVLMKPKPEGDLGNPQYPPSPWHVDNIERSILDVPESSNDQPWMQFPSAEEEADKFSFAVLAEASGSITDPSREQRQEQVSDETKYSPLVAQILSYAYSHVVPTTWPNESGKVKWTYEISRTWDDIASITEDLCYASALLCFYATLMATATNDKDIASQACFFQVQAMTELRQRLANQPAGHDPLTLKAILKLFSAETALDNTAAARVHLKTLRNFVAAGGGVIMLDPWFRENLLATDCYFALKYETRPLFPASEWTPGSLNQPWATRLVHARTPDDHSLKMDEGIEHANLRGVITDLRELFRLERYLNSHDVSADDQLLRWRQLRKFDCINRLAEHQLNVKIYPHLYANPKVQLAICATVSLVSAMVLGCPEPTRSGLKLLTELRTKVTEARAEIGQRCGDAGDEVQVDCANVMLWILYVGTLGEQTHPVAETSIWFSHEFDARLRDLGLSKPGFEQDILKNFLYSPVLEDEIRSSRSSRSSEARKGVYEASGMSWRAPLEQIAKVGPVMEEGEPVGKGRKNSEVICPILLGDLE